ncbi:MAG TPA: 3-ketoacyl-ACP reductase [Spirochaetia bacterium]|nr:3-ketoacyl-ACP reductase [Spirochaetia bacterium]
MTSEHPGLALITGGARGIGLGISRELARVGYDLALCGSRPAAAASTLEELRRYGGRVEYLQADIGTDRGREGLLPAVEKLLGTPNLLVNNAGVAPAERRDLLEATPESYDRVMGINLRGPYFLTQAVARAMVARRSADPSFQCAIVFITSVSSTVASTNRGEYCLSKAALSMAAKLWSVRLAEFGIPVYEVRPGIITSDMTSAVKEKYDAMIEGGLLLDRRWGTGEDVGKAVRMLSSGDLSYSTGQVVMVDGGMTVDRL